MLSGWICTDMRSTGTPNSQWASITSSPLFMRVAESIVILRPMDQLGWQRAASGVTASSSLLGLLKKGPPGGRKEHPFESFPVVSLQGLKNSAVFAVHGENFDILAGCSVYYDLPAATRVSLFASAIFFPASIAERVGKRPAAPTIADTSISASGKAATLQ